MIHPFHKNIEVLGRAETHFFIRELCDVLEAEGYNAKFFSDYRTNLTKELAEKIVSDILLKYEEGRGKGGKHVQLLISPPISYAVAKVIDLDVLFDQASFAILRERMNARK